MRLNKKMIGKQVSVIAYSKTGFKRITGKLVAYRAGEVDVSVSSHYGNIETFERSEGWKIESVK